MRSDLSPPPSSTPSPEGTTRTAWMGGVAVRFDEQLSKQQALVSRYRLVSPALLAQSVLNDAAGSGDARFAHFEAQVRTFAEEWRGYFVPAILAGQVMTAEAAMGRPEFVYSEEELSVVLGRSAMPLAMLLTLALLAVVPAAIRLGRVRGGG